MKLDPIKFSTRFGVRAAQVADSGTLEKPQKSEAPPSDSFVGRVAKKLSSIFTPQTRASQKALAARVALSTLGAPTSLALAQEIGVEMKPAGDPSGQEFLSKKADQVVHSSGPNEKMDRVWHRIAEVTGTKEKRPTLLDDSGSGPGRFVGRTMVADVKAFGELSEETALFYTAHELGHLENNDASRKTGMTALAQQLPPESQGLIRDARQDKDWEMEHKADARAAEIAAKAGCDPKPILLDLLTEPSGTQHPPGLERAKRVRKVMAENGKSVSETDWNNWVKSTQSERAERQVKVDADRDWLESWDHIV